jgi:hypothetical protein
MNKVGGPIGPPNVPPLVGRREGRGPPAMLVGATMLRVRPTPERPLSGCDQDCLAQPRGDGRGGMADTDHKRAAADWGLTGVRWKFCFGRRRPARTAAFFKGMVFGLR